MPAQSAEGNLLAIVMKEAEQRRAEMVDYNKRLDRTITFYLVLRGT